MDKDRTNLSRPSSRREGLGTYQDGKWVVTDRKDNFPTLPDLCKDWEKSVDVILEISKEKNL